MVQRVYTLPDWLITRSDSLLDEWEARHGFHRIDQHEWRYPRRGDWSARVDEILADAPASVMLIAEGLGCALLAWWAAHSKHVDKVQSAVLLNPLDCEDFPAAQMMLSGWVPLTQLPFPFHAVLLQEQGDVRASWVRALSFGQHWGASCVQIQKGDQQAIFNHDALKNHSAYFNESAKVDTPI